MKKSHERVAELLPWMVNATLDNSEDAEVREHVSDCVTCRDHLELLAELYAAVQEGPSAEVDSFEALDAMRLRLEHDGAAESGRARPRPPSRLVRWVLFAQAAALVFALGLIFFQRANPQPPPTSFRTLADTSPATAATDPQARVLFSEGATERQIRELLHQIGGRIVDGPSEMGLYTVELETDAGDSATVVNRVEALRHDTNVRFVELVSRGSLSPSGG